MTKLSVRALTPRPYIAIEIDSEGMAESGRDGRYNSITECLKTHRCALLLQHPVPKEAHGAQGTSAPRIHSAVSRECQRMRIACRGRKHAHVVHGHDARRRCGGCIRAVSQPRTAAPP
eukprot:scaffold146533_cov32-Tisochrysis_lutea.AAC.3